MMEAIKLAIIDHDSQAQQHYRDNLSKNPHFHADIQFIDLSDNLKKKLGEPPVDCIIIAQNALQSNQALLSKLTAQEQWNKTAIIIALDQFEEMTAFNYLQQGCDAYVEKTMAGLAKLRLTILNAIKQKKLIAKDITNEKRLEKHSFLDPVTNLYNVRPFFEVLHKSLSAAKRHGFNVGLLYIDIDDYDVVQKEFGGEVSRQLLAQFGQRMLEMTREEDVVGRIGENEFAVIASCPTSADDCNIIGQRIIDSLSQPFELSNKSINISASLGIAFSWDMHNNMESVVKESKQDLSQTKQQGRGIFQMHFN